MITWIAENSILIILGYLDIFKSMLLRSTDNKVKYGNYIGDGESKIYTGLTDPQPYGKDFLIHKKIFVGHVQKRMSTRLRYLVKIVLTQQLEKIQTKGFSGNSKLTSKMLDRLTVYYGLAIHRNYDSVKKIYCYCNCYVGLPERRRFILRIACRKKLKDFKYSYTARSSDVLEAIKPIYEKLSKDNFISHRSTT